MNSKEIKRKQFEELKRKGIFRLTGVCSTCGSTETTCFHHIVPLSMPNGTNYVGNVIELCYECHRQAHGGLNFLKEPTDRTREIISKTQTKMIKIKYDFSAINENIVGEGECKGYDASVDFINDIIRKVNDTGNYIKWAKTSGTYATSGARKTINKYSREFNDEYKLFRKDYEYGYIEIYTPYKRGIA